MILLVYNNKILIYEFTTLQLISIPFNIYSVAEIQIICAIILFKHNIGQLYQNSR